MPDSPPSAGTLVGRAGEIRMLASLVGLPPEPGDAPPRPGEDASGTAKAVLLAGDAGVGKTRLLAELRARAARDGWRVLVGHCLDFGGDWVPYLPFSDVFGSLLADSPELVGQLLAASPALSRLLPGHRREDVGDDARDDEPPPAEARAGPSRALLHEAVRAALRQLSRQAPVLLVLEDLHWADPSTRQLLSLLFTREPDVGCTVVASYRSDDLHRRHPLRADVAHWSRLPRVTRLHLRPLPDPDVRALVRALDPDGLAAPVTDSIVARAEGNAFFTEELVAAARRGERVLTSDVADLLLLHLDALDDTTRTVLRAMSVAGRRVSHETLARVLGDDGPGLDAALRTALDRNVLVPAPPGGYAFRHALLAEAVYDDLLPGERVRWHRAYAGILAAAVPGGERGTAAELARHALAAHDLPTALSASVLAGDEAMGVGGPAEATRHYEQALGLLVERGAAAGGPDAAELSLRLCESATAAGLLQRALALVQDQLELLAPDADPQVRVRLLLAVAGTALLQDAPVDDLELSAQAVRLAPDGPLRAQAMVVHARANAARERQDEAARWAARAVGLAREHDLPRVLADATAVLTRATWSADPERARRTLQAAIGQARAAGDAAAELRITHNLGTVLYALGELGPAQEAYEQAARRAAEMRRPWAPFGIDGRVMAAVVSHARGRWQEAERFTDTSGEQPPDLARAMLEAARLGVCAGRGDVSALPALAGLRPWWARDGLLALHTGAAGVDLLGDSGRPDDAVVLHDEVVAHLSALWDQPEFQARIRLDGLLLGQLAAAAARLGGRERAALAATGDALHASARRAYAAAARNGPESRAWMARVEAEHLRLRHLAGDAGVDAGDLTAAWRGAVEAFERFGHVFELARSRTRLSAALRAAGDREAADAEARLARAVAAPLGAAPLLRELDAVAGAARSPAGHLTEREREVLSLVAQGRSNREIGQVLFISTKTVSVHVSNVLAKLPAGSRTEAVAVARRRGLLPA